VVPEKYPYSPHGRLLEIPSGRGVLKAKLLEGQYEAKLEFPEECGGAKQKAFRGGSMDIFWNYTISNHIIDKGIPMSSESSDELFLLSGLESHQMIK